MRFVSRIAIAILGLLVLEALCFSCILLRKNEDVASDAVLVFMGSEKRVETGYRLVNQGLAPVLILSSVTAALRRCDDKKYALKSTVVNFPENRATSTFENALYTSRIIKSHGYKSVLLVTSDYHMPRSLILLKLFLMGDDVEIHSHEVHDVARTATADAVLPKLLYNEMVKFWGSLLECAMYPLRGRLFEKPANKSAFWVYLKSFLLLNI